MSRSGGIVETNNAAYLLGGLRTGAYARDARERRRLDEERLALAQAEALAEMQRQQAEKEALIGQLTGPPPKVGPAPPGASPAEGGRLIEWQKAQEALGKFAVTDLRGKVDDQVASQVRAQSREQELADRRAAQIQKEADRDALALQEEAEERAIRQGLKQTLGRFGASDPDLMFAMDTLPVGRAEYFAQQAIERQMRKQRMEEGIRNIGGDDALIQRNLAREGLLDNMTAQGREMLQAEVMRESQIKDANEFIDSLRQSGTKVSDNQAEVIRRNILAGRAPLTESQAKSMGIFAEPEKPQSDADRRGDELKVLEKIVDTLKDVADRAQDQVFAGSDDEVRAAALEAQSAFEQAEAELLRAQRELLTETQTAGLPAPGPGTTRRDGTYEFADSFRPETQDRVEVDRLNERIQVARDRQKGMRPGSSEHRRLGEAIGELELRRDAFAAGGSQLRALSDAIDLVIKTAPGLDDDEVMRRAQALIGDQ